MIFEFSIYSFKKQIFLVYWKYSILLLIFKNSMFLIYKKTPFAHLSNPRFFFSKSSTNKFLRFPKKNKSPFPNTIDLPTMAQATTKILKSMPAQFPLINNFLCTFNWLLKKTSHYVPVSGRTWCVALSDACGHIGSWNFEKKEQNFALHWTWYLYSMHPDRTLKKALWLGLLHSVSRFHPFPSFFLIFPFYDTTRTRVTSRGSFTWF